MFVRKCNFLLKFNFIRGFRKLKMLHRIDIVFMVFEESVDKWKVDREGLDWTYS